MSVALRRYDDDSDAFHYGDDEHDESHHEDHEDTGGCHRKFPNFVLYPT